MPAHGAYYILFVIVDDRKKPKQHYSRKRVDLTFEIEECRSLSHFFMITINLRDIAKFSVYSPLHL